MKKKFYAVYRKRILGPCRLAYIRWQMQCAANNKADALIWLLGAIDARNDAVQILIDLSKESARLEAALQSHIQEMGQP